MHYFRADAMQGEWGEDRGLGSSSGSGACLHYERYVHHLRSILSLMMDDLRFLGRYDSEHIEPKEMGM